MIFFSPPDWAVYMFEFLTEKKGDICVRQVEFKFNFSFLKILAMSVKCSSRYI